MPLAESDHNYICGSCLHEPPFYHSSTIPLNYTYPTNIIVKQLKYKEKVEYSKLLASFIVNLIQQRNHQLPECIIPVPLHPIRLMKRGYNQSQLLAKQISAQINIPVHNHYCKRIKNTAQQTNFSHKQRITNLKGAFSVQTNIPYKHVAIIDDVVTTGSTVNELSKSLSLSGVETIEVWASARTNLNTF